MNEPRPSAKALATAVVRAQDGEGTAASSLPKIHSALRKLLGSHGTDVLLSRALRLAQKGEPGLTSATIGPNGTLERIEGADSEAPVVALLSHVFELLMRFIGEDLANRLIGDIWPDAAAIALTETKR